MKTSLKTPLLALLATCGLAPALSAQSTNPHAAPTQLQRSARLARTDPWDPEILRLIERVPVQDGGRVKPLSTLAGFQLLRLNGKRKVVTPDGQKLSAIEWLLDVFFHPQQSLAYECFQVRNSEVLYAAGIKTEGKKKADRFSYHELEPGIDRLFELARSYSTIDSKLQTAVQRDTILLAQNISTFETLAHFLDFADHRFPTSATEPLQAIYGPQDVVGLSGVLAHRDALLDHWLAVREATDGPERAQRAAVSALIGALEHFTMEGRLAPEFVPPDADEHDHKEWMNTAGVIEAAFAGHPTVNEGMQLISGLEGMVAALGDPGALRDAAQRLHDVAADLATSRGEYAKVPAEVSFYDLKFFSRALALYLLGFLLVAATWLTGPRRWLTAATWAVSAGGTLLVVAGVAYRCYLRARPPVSTLYETILFITGCIGITALFVEWVNRKRIMLALAPIIGAMGMFLANKYELREAATAGDTMPSLVAVLDTNFWLATHVTTITLGYAAGLLAAAISHVWMLGKIFGRKRGDDAFYRNVTRMVYGVIAFALVFSVVGTILGGIWANYSWGRFWGWDPKENGALLICLSQLFILHARLGGYVRAHGLHVLSIIQGCVVTFSWWGVNQLGVGLHSYGFTEGIMRNLILFWGLETLVILASGVWSMARREGPAPPMTPVA